VGAPPTPPEGLSRVPREGWVPDPGGGPPAGALSPGGTVWEPSGPQNPEIPEIGDFWQKRPF